MRLFGLCTRRLSMEISLLRKLEHLWLFAIANAAISPPDILDTNVFDLSIREILPRRSQWNQQFKQEILDARVHVSGRKILQCVVDAEELAEKKMTEKAVSPLEVEGKENGSAFIIEVRPKTAEEMAYNKFELKRNFKSDRASMEREAKDGKKRKREEKAYIAGGVAVVVEDSGSKRRTRSMGRTKES
ncbi:hypothetical protein EAE96_000991 [Botrytis aclada]|nr:hypothetical protein EAE96_000991 [Botrytis aclada]